MKHKLKTDPAVFEDVMAGTKLFEIRLNDRDYQVGDTLELVKTKHTGAEMKAGAPLEYTGDAIFADVVGILHGPIYGLEAGWCIMSIHKGTTRRVYPQP